MLTTAALAPCSGPTGTRGRDRGTTRYACAAPLRLGSICGRGVRCPRAGTGPVDPCRARPSAPAPRAGGLLTALLRGSGAAGLIASRHSPTSYLRRDPTHLRLYESASLTFSPIADALVAYCMALPAAVAPETSSNLPVLTS